MKRSGPPQRRKGLSAGKPLSRGGRLRPRSKRMAETYAEERRPLVADLLSAQPRCQLRVLCEGDPSVDVHEILRRSRGGSITDPRNCLTACRPCHEWVTVHDREACCLGLSLPSWATQQTTDPWEVAEALRALRMLDRVPCPWRKAGDRCWSTDDGQRVRCDAVSPPAT